MVMDSGKLGRRDDFIVEAIAKRAMFSRTVPANRPTSSADNRPAGRTRSGPCA